MSRKTALKLAVCQLFAGLFCLVFVIAHAGLDAPHNIAGCLSCHNMTSTYPKLLPDYRGTNPDPSIDNTVANGVCWSCHTSSGGVEDPPYVLTHSSLTTSTKHGNWTVECWVCHNQHLQEQNRYNGSTYGKYIRRSINLKNITDGSGNPLPGKVLPDQPYSKSVIFKGSTGANSFADGDTTINGICEVCHTTSSHSRNNDNLGGDKHFQAYVCTECHDHTTGFKPGWPDHDQVVEKPAFCTTCHATSVFALHQVNETDYTTCKRCHQTNNNYEFTGTLPTIYLEGRLTKHLGKNKLVFPATAPARCDDCHHGQFTEHVTDTGHNKLHDKVVLGYDTDNDGSGDQVLACDACHFPDAIQEHVTRRNFTCSICHDRAGLGLAEVAAITGTIGAGMGGTPVFCDDCHDDDHFLTEPGTSLVKEHHATPYSKGGECTKCHVVGPGERGPHRPPCWYCHATGKPGDPQRAGVNRHDQGPAITADAVKDFRVCFSCHLDGSQGYVSGVTPLARPMHGLPNTDYSKVYWPYGYYRDASNQWVASDPLIPSDANPVIPANLENDPARWSTWPGWHTLNYLGEIKKKNSTLYSDYTAPEVRTWAAFSTYDIRDMVDIAYRKQDYPTVSIRNGGVFEVPSFDGTGTVGKPTGSGSMSVTLNPEAVTAGAQWRLDGGPWQDSNDILAAVTDRTNHLVEFKPMAGMDEPSPLRVTVVNGQATALNGAAATYATCPENPQLRITRTSGDTNATFAWTSPEQVENFQVTGWRSGPVTCELWRKNGGELLAAEGFATTAAAGGDGCELFKDGATPAGGYDLILRVTGSSCFRNSTDLPLAVTVTPAGALSPTGQAGGMISEPFLNSLTLPTTANHDFLHLSGNVYVHINAVGVISTFTIDSQGNISSVLASIDLWSGNGNFAQMVRVNDTLVAISYNIKTGVDNTYETRLMTVGIELNGTVLAKKNDYLFHTAGAQWSPRIYPHHVNSNLFIVTWGGNGGSYFRGLITVRISPSGTIDELDRDMSLPGAWMEKGAITHVAGDNYAYVGNKHIYIFQVNAEGAITILNTPGSHYQFSTDGYYAEMTRVKGNIFAVAYIKNYVIGPGILKTLSISDSGMISPTINTHMFEPGGAGYADPPKLYSLTDNVLGIFYDEYGGCDGSDGINLKTFEITDDGRIMVPPLDTLELRGGNVTPALLHVGGDIYAFLVDGDLSQGVTFNGVKTFRISRDADQDGIASDSDNCSEISNAGQADADGDGTGDSCDACPGSDDGLDADSDGIPDACDTCAGHDDTVDSDSEGTPDGCDPCPGDPNNDADNDGICAGSGFNAPKNGDGDNCPLTDNGEQIDSDCDGSGDACDTTVHTYSPPTSLDVAVQPFVTDSLVSWGDTFNGENAYRVERKSEACTANTLSFTPLATIYQLDDFATGLDLAGWVPGEVSDTSGSSSVTWDDGAVVLHTVSTNVGDNGFNYSYIQPKNFAGIVGDKDFDIQVDFSLPGTIAATQYFSYTRFDMYLPDTNGNQNSMYVGRMKDGVEFYAMVNGVAESGGISTTALSGTLRMIRRNRQLSGYFWDGTNWTLLYKHSQPLTADLSPTWTIVVQHANRNENQDITAMVDNFRFNTVGSMPVAALRMDLEEASWTGAAGEVRDSTADSNHGRAFNGASTTSLNTGRGTVGIFNGSDDYLEISGSGTLQNVTDSSFTFAAWAKPMSVPPQADAAPPSGTADDWIYAIVGRPGWHTDLHYNQWKQFRFEIWNDTPAQFGVNSAAYDPGQWHHLAGVVDNTSKTVTLYVDGQSAGSTNYTGNLRDYGTLPYYIGTSNHDAVAYNWFFQGMIDDVRIFDRALTASEVTSLYGNRMQYKDTGLTADAAYCYQVYPLKNDTCPNWASHAAEFSYTAPSNALPNQPANLTPGDGVTDVHTLHPILTASAFSDPDGGDTHYASRWRISRASGADFPTNLVYNSGPVSPATSHNVTTALAVDTTYYWKVAYQDSKGVWSAWSSETSFIISNIPPHQPVNSSPTVDETGIMQHPTLTASAFADNDAGNTQQASQWQISTGSGGAFDAGIVYDSGIAAAANSHTVTGNLSALTTFFWKVRYQDNLGGWSPYSNESSFTTGTVYSLFSNKRVITLSTATPANDYQIRIDLNTANFDYSKVQTGGVDIRFYDSAEIELSYWVETWNTNGTSTIWVKIPSADTDTIYISYGNNTLSSASNGDATFLFFDDFEGTTIDSTKWTQRSGEAVSSGIVALDISTNNQVSTEDYIYASTFNTPINSVIELRHKASATNTISRFGITDQRTTFYLNNANYVGIQLFQDGNFYYDTNDGATLTQTGSGSYDTSWHIYKLVWTTNLAQYYQDGTSRGQYTTNVPTATDTLHPFLRDISTTDWIRIRKYSSIEPTASIGAEM